MSGPIRQLIGPTRSRLVNILSDLSVKLDEFTVDDQIATEDNIQLAKQHLFALASLHARIVKAVDTLSSCNQQWSQLLQSLSEEERAKEEVLYNSNVEKPDSFINVLVQAQDNLAILEVRIKEIQEVKRSLESALLTPPVRAMTPTFEGQFEGQNASIPHGAYPQGLTSMPQSMSISGTRQLPEQLMVRNQMLPIVKFPKLPVNEFYGDETKFQSFWDQFQKIHLNSDVANVDKFMYLSGALRGKAKDVIEGISITNDNYMIAVNLLLKRYGNKRIAKQALYTKLDNLPRSGKNTLELIQTHDALGAILRSLEQLQENLNHITVIKQIKSKFPAGIILKLEEMKDSDDDWTVGELRQNLQKIIDQRRRTIGDLPQAQTKGSHMVGAANRGDFVSSSKFQKSNKFSGSQNMRKQQTQNVTLKVQSKNIREVKPKYPCVFCGNSHFHDNCDKVKTVAQRVELLKAQQRCMLCFNRGHFKSKCPMLNQTKPCFYCKNKQHNKALCPVQFGSGTVSGGSPQLYYNSKFQAKPSTWHSTSAHLSSNDKVALESATEGKEDKQERPSSQLFTTALNKVNSTLSCVAAQKPLLEMLLTAKVTLINMKNPQKQMQVRVVLDGASEKSYLLNTVKNELAVDADYPETLHVLAFGADKPQPMKSHHVTVGLQLQDGSVMKIGAHAVNHISAQIRRPGLPSTDLEMLKPYEPDLADVIPVQTEEFIPELLLGIKYFLSFVKTNYQIALPSGLVIVPSELGLLVGGSNDNSADPTIIQCDGEFQGTTTDLPIVTVKTSCYMANMISSPLLHPPDVSTSWDLETIGNKDPPQVNDDDVVLNLFNKRMEFKENAYYLAWLWKDEQPNLPSNRDVALKRFQSLMKRYESDKEKLLLKACDDIIKDQLAHNYIEMVPDESCASGLIHYLPHRAVVTPSRTTTKVRIVMDASSKASPNVNSLNDCLYRGPIILPNLPGTIMRFRFYKYGLISDVAKAFLQMMLHLDQRDVTRFFWVKDINHQPLCDRNNLVVYRFTRVLFGSKCSPSMLNLTIDFHLSQYSSDVAQLIRQNMYVDNFIGGGQSLQECIKIYTEGVTMFREAGMHLRQWGSNCPEFVEMLDPKDKANDMNQASVLGMKWNISSDELMLNRVVIPTVVNTKRHILETISSFFDPLGLCNPLIVGPKLFIQQLWKEKLSWDHHLSSELMKKLETLLTQLLFLESFTIPRFVGIPEDLVAFHLIAFTDASTDAYAANVYICKEAPNGCTFDLLFSKVRLAPAKGLSIPRMELMGVLIGIRLLKYVKGELAVPIVNTFLWTDSQCVLYWIRSTKRLPVFIQNRINEIKEKGTNVILKYIETHHNPADLTTRPQSATSFKENLEMWLHGPKFLHCSTSEWPTFMKPEVSPKKIDEWESHDEKIVFASMSLLSPQKQLASPIIDINRFSSFKSVLLFTAILLLVIGKLIWQYVPAQLKSQYPVLSNLLGFNASHGFTADVISKARFYWEWHTQHEVFSDILDSFHTGKLHPMVKQLNLFLDSNGLNSFKRQTSTCTFLL